MPDSDGVRVKPYDHRNCSSLFGYSAAVHARSGGICQLCGAGSNAVDFDIWRQLTVEHLIGESQGGYRAAILTAVAHRYPALQAAEATALVNELDAINTVTACSFCNATTSRNRAPVSMAELLDEARDPAAAIGIVREACTAILGAKRRDVAWKLESVRHAFDEQIRPTLLASRPHR